MQNEQNPLENQDVAHETASAAEGTAAAPAADLEARLVEMSGVTRITASA